MIDLSVTASKIASARKEKGYTQEELAVRLGVSSQAVSKWERALSLPDIELLFDLSKMLDVSLEFLLDKDATAVSAAVKVTAYDPPRDGFGTVDAFERVKRDPILIQFGIGLIPSFNEEYLHSISKLRLDILRGWNVLIPTIRIRDEVSIGDMEYVINIFDKTVLTKTYDSATDETAADMLAQLSSALTGRLSSFVNRHMVKLLVESLRTQMPFVVDGVIPERISLSVLRIVLKSLVAKGKPITNLIEIIETIDDCIEENPQSRTEDFIARLLGAVQ